MSATAWERAMFSGIVLSSRLITRIILIKYGASDPCSAPPSSSRALVCNATESCMHGFALLRARPSVPGSAKRITPLMAAAPSA